MKLGEMGLVLVAGVALGSNVVMVRVGIGDIPPMTFTLLRFLTTLVLFGVTVVITRRSVPRGGRWWLDIAISAVANTVVPVIAFTYALQHISSGVLGVLMALYPMLTAVLAHFFFAQHERLTLIRILGLVLGLSGSLLLVLTGTTGLGEAGNALGYGLAGIGVTMGALGVIYIRKRLANDDPTVVTGAQILLTVPVLIPFALAEPRLDLASVPLMSWGAIVYAGLVGSFLGYLLLFVLIKRYGATSGALPGYVIPVVSTLLGALLLDEVITLMLIAGAGMVLTGVFLVSSVQNGAAEDRREPQSREDGAASQQAEGAAAVVD